jgi:predicted nucleic acid-binding protein
MALYVDTSALVKRYLPERASQRWERFVIDHDDDLLISPLTLTEIESTLQRRLRQRDIDEPFLARTRDLLARDLEASLWLVMPFDPNVLPQATRLIREVGVPLSTLDAIHLASAQACGCEGVATGDRQFARAVQRCGLAVHVFADSSGRP